MGNLIIKRRTAYLFSTVSISLVLFMIGTIFYMVMNASKATNSILENMKMVVILDDKTTEKDIEEIKKIVNKTELISKIEYTSKDEAAEKFKKYIGEDFELKLGSNPLPASLDLYLKSDEDIKKNVATIKLKLAKNKNVEEILYQHGVMDTLLSNISRFNMVLAFFGFALLAVSLIMIDNSIKTAVLSKRFLIKSMLLIGATRNFIRRPFLLKALMQAFWATLIGSIMLGILIVGLKKALPSVELIYENIKVLMLIPASMFVVAIIICFFSTIFAVNKYMTLSNDELHSY